jgi:hypothetical protein
MIPDADLAVKMPRTVTVNLINRRISVAGARIKCTVTVILGTDLVAAKSG